ncbi:MAG: hypothetical protein M3Y81_23890 [Chloroflexota bacterium]|nr:hypothetical protein [Chloroflexota bacterium]
MGKICDRLGGGFWGRDDGMGAGRRPAAPVPGMPRVVGTERRPAAPLHETRHAARRWNRAQASGART